MFHSVYQVILVWIIQTKTNHTITLCDMDILCNTKKAVKLTQIK